jgi:putative zinc finger/helix-turn-helix YgiT family protein
MICFECGRGALTEGVFPLVGERHGESFTVMMDGLRCAACGFVTIDSRQSVKFTQLVSDAYRQAHGLLTGVEIRACRDHLDMNQQQFSEYLGVGAASVKRWEAGHIQEKAMDELIRLKTNLEAARNNLDKVKAQIHEPHVVSASVELELRLSGSPLKVSDPRTS